MSQKCHKQKIQYLQGLQVKCHMSQKFLGVILALGTSGGLGAHEPGAYAPCG